MIPCCAAGTVDLDIAGIFILAWRVHWIIAIHTFRQIHPMVRTFTSIALVEHIGLCAIRVVGAPLVNSKVVVTVRSSTTNLIAVVQIGAIERPRGNLVYARAAYITPPGPSNQTHHGTESRKT